MSTKPKKSRSKKMQPTTPTAPEVPTTPVQPMPTVGTTIMALSPALNGQWQMATVVANLSDPNTPLIQFGDGAQYLASFVQWSQPVAPTAAVDGQVPGTGYTANVGTMDTLQPRYAQFRTDAVALYEAARDLFQMPLQSVITMAYRQAYRAELESHGTMAVIGNESVFVPDEPTFERWITSYLEEVQRREVEANGPEA